MDADTPGNLPEFTVSEHSGAVKRTIEGAFDRVRGGPDLTGLRHSLEGQRDASSPLFPQ